MSVCLFGCDRADSTNIGARRRECPDKGRAVRARVCVSASLGLYGRRTLSLVGMYIPRLMPYWLVMIREIFFLQVFAYFFTISLGHWTCFRLRKRQTVMASRIYIRAAVRLARSLCYKLSVTRFFQIQFGRQQLSLSLPLEAIRNFSSSSSLFLFPFFFHIIFAAPFGLFESKRREKTGSGALWIATLLDWCNDISFI